MMQPRDILLKCLRRNIRLTPNGDLLSYEFVSPPGADILEILREHKPALLRYLKALRHLAKQVIAGEFTGADSATIQSVIGELRSNHVDPHCRAAIYHLKACQRTQNHQ